MIDLDNNQFVTIELLAEDQVRSVINGVIDQVNDSIRVQMISSLKFLQITTKSNALVSGLNTDSMAYVYSVESSYATFFEWRRFEFSLLPTCEMANVVAPQLVSTLAQPVRLLFCSIPMY